MMSELITVINKKIVPSYEMLVNKLLGKATLNIGVIRGGNAFNIVPDSCQIELDRRVLPEETLDGVLQQFSEAISEISFNNHGFIAEIEKINDYIPYLKMDESDTSIKNFKKYCELYNTGSKITGLPYATDGGFTFQGGIPTFVFGPGEIKNTHKLEEYVSREQLQTAFMILKDFIFSY